MLTENCESSGQTPGQQYQYHDPADCNILHGSEKILIEMKTCPMPGLKVSRDLISLYHFQYRG